MKMRPLCTDTGHKYNMTDEVKRSFKKKATSWCEINNRHTVPRISSTVFKAPTGVVTTSALKQGQHQPKNGFLQHLPVLESAFGGKTELLDFFFDLFIMASMCDSIVNE